MAVTESFSTEKENMAVDMMIALVVEVLAEETHQPAETIMPQFLQSKMCAMLYDHNTKLWWEGPSDIAEQYLAEQKLSAGIS